MHIQDIYSHAVYYANKKTREKFGDNSVPTENGSQEHDYWLEKFDYAINDMLS